jgi:hypothetical protein
MSYTEADSYHRPNVENYLHFCQHFMCVGGLIYSLVS